MGLYKKTIDALESDENEEKMRETRVKNYLAMCKVYKWYCKNCTKMENKTKMLLKFAKMYSTICIC